MRPVALPPNLALGPTVPHRPRGADSPESLHRAAQQFEALFLHMVLKAGHSGESREGLFGRSNGEEIFTDMRDAQFSKIAAEHGGFGIAEMLERQWAERLTRTPPEAALGGAVQGDEHG